jgi:protein gp37
MWREVLRWQRDAHRDGVRARVFCASWADVWEDFDGEVIAGKAGTPIDLTLDDLRARLFHTIAATPDLDWLLLTKRPWNIERMAPATWRENWPSNVWLGTTVEDQRRAEERIPHLVQHRSVVRFLSVEPQLGPLDLSKWIHEIDWVIAGGESGGGARPTRVEWARSLRDQCVEGAVAFFFKQWGQFAQVAGSERLVRLPTKNERVLDGRTWDQLPAPKTDARRRP